MVQAATTLQFFNIEHSIGMNVPLPQIIVVHMQRVPILLVPLVARVTRDSVAMELVVMMLMNASLGPIIVAQMRPAQTL